MDTTIKRKTMFNYFGGKTRHLDWLLPLFPPVNTYVHYVEVFCGSAVCFLNKEPSPIETINDLDGDVINFIQVLRNRPDELIQLLELTPYSREEFISASLMEGDELEQARCFFVRVMQSFGALGPRSTKTTSWRIDFKESRYGVSCSVSKYWQKVSGLKEVVDRLRIAQIDNRDFRYILTNYDTPSTFFYLDSPYDHKARTGKKDYKFEFTEQDHRDMAEMLYKIKGRAMVSGYDSELLHELYTAKGWIKTFGPDRIVNLGKSKKREIVWTNYNPIELKNYQLFQS